MTHLDDFIETARAQPDAAHLTQLADLYLAEATTSEQRQQIRAAAAVPLFKQAYENLYFEGVGMDDPPMFVRRTLAALFMTRGFGHVDTARQIVSELETFADHHRVDYATHYDEVRALAGVPVSRARRIRFLIGNAALLGTLALGTAALQVAPEGARLVLQIVLLLGVVGTQMAFLYWYFRRD
ncbi:MAG: hypothetical protein CL610_14455 [Anaerolineaceae bacterium]|nr:hypothetical protein [Anaerolineaceae bacterium]